MQGEFWGVVKDGDQSRRQQAMSVLTGERLLDNPFSRGRLRERTKAENRNVSSTP